VKYFEGKSSVDSFYIVFLAEERPIALDKGNQNGNITSQTWYKVLCICCGIVGGIALIFLTVIITEIKRKRGH
jgi:hypothetical protein